MKNLKKFIVLITLMLSTGSFAQSMYINDVNDNDTNNIVIKTNESSISDFSNFLNETIKLNEQSLTVISKKETETIPSNRTLDLKNTVSYSLFGSENYRKYLIKNEKIKTSFFSSTTFLA